MNLRSPVTLMLGGLCLVAPAGRALGQLVAPDPMAVDRLMRAEVDSGFSGVVRILRGDSTLLWRVYAPTGSTLQPNSPFWIASMTKGFTALGILTLVHHGTLALTDSLGALLPGVPSAKRSITVEQLLTHTAGLAGGESGVGISDREAAIAAILSPPLAHPPGQGYHYGDGDYELLAALIERVTGQAWRDYIQAEILEPIGLRETGFWCGPLTVALPVPRVDGTASRCTQPDRGTLHDDWGHRGANGMSSTANDLLRWIRALDASEAIPLAVRQQMAEPRVLVRQEDGFEVYAGYGLRIYSREGRVIERWYSGSGDDGHTVAVRVLANGITILVLSNGGWRGQTPWASYLASLLYPRRPQ